MSVKKRASQKSVIISHALTVAETLAEVFEHAACHLSRKTGKFEGLEENAATSPDLDESHEEEPTERAKDGFMRLFFEPMLNDPNLDPHAEPDPPIGGKDADFLAAMMQSCMCAASAVRKADEGDVNTAQLDLFDALYWCGVAVGYAEAVSPASQAIKRLTKRAADALHAENRAMKAEALEWYAVNRHLYANKDDAAFAIAKKIIPAEFSTVRGWLKEPKKQA